MYIFSSWAWKVIKALNMITWKTIIDYWWHLKNLAIIKLLFFRVLPNGRAELIIYGWTFFLRKSIIVWRHKKWWCLNNWIWIHNVNETFIFSQNNTENKDASFSLIWNHSYFSSKNIHKILTYDKSETYTLSIHLFWILNWSEQFK